MTECNQTAFGFEAHFSRRVVAQFDGQTMTTEGGALLLRETDRRVGLLGRVARCFSDARDPQRIEHPLEELLAQRLYALALGYEDLNDHEELRRDPLLALLAGKREIEEPLACRGRLAGKSTLNRMELTPAGEGNRTRSAITRSPTRRKPSTRCWWGFFWKRTRRRRARSCSIWTPPTRRCTATKRGVSSTATTTTTVTCRCTSSAASICCAPACVGQARLRPSNLDSSAGNLEEVQRIVAQIRARWPKVRIVLRGDSGFCREELMAWCETHGVDYVFGFARNERLRRKIARELREAKREHRRTGKAARVLTEFSYRTRASWSRSRRVVAKAEHLAQGENPRYVVTSLAAQRWEARALYEQLYCARGEMENRIKEQLSLFSDRRSTETLRANQLRLYFSSLAYVLVHALRRLALAGTEWATAQVETMRLRLLKIAAEVHLTARRIRVRYSNAYPWKNLFAAAWQALRC